MIDRRAPRRGSGQRGDGPGSVVTMGQDAGTRRRGLDSLTVRILLGLGFLLAVAASLFVVLADEVRWLRLAVLLGLWAALLTAFAMARYRREARSAELRQEEMTRIYELELHREISARREYEVQLAETTRAELESRHDTELAALREQVERLTSVLTGFLDGDLLVERLTLSAEATRIRSVGDGGSAQSIGSVTRQLVEGTVGQSGPLDAGTVWGPQPPPLHGPLPAAKAPDMAGPSSGIPLDASAGAVTEQIPRIVEPAAPRPVIDALPVTPRVVGDPHHEPAESPEETVEPPDAAVMPAEQPVGPQEVFAEVPEASVEAADAGVGAADAQVEPAGELVDPPGERVEPAEPLDVATDGPNARSEAADVPDHTDDEVADLVEIEHGATEPEPDSEPESEPEAESVRRSVGDGAPAADAVISSGESADSADSSEWAGQEFRPATDVPDAPSRSDSPATAWTLRHRLDTPAAPPIVRASGSRRASRAAAAAADDQPSEAVAEITSGAKDPAGHSSGVSVAELLAAYGSSVPPRRRRHSDD